MNLLELENITNIKELAEIEDSKEFNGHKNWSHWNVSVWLDNDEDNYNYVQHLIKRYLKRDIRFSTIGQLTRILKNHLPAKTPDGARYSYVALQAYLETEIKQALQYQLNKG